MIIRHEDETSAAVEPVATPTEPVIDLDAAALAAFEVGAAEAAEADEAPAPVVADPATETPAPVETPEPAAEAAAPDAAEVADVDVDAEVAAHGLKGKSEARFRELAGTIRELAPMKAALATAGITDVAQLPEIIGRAQRLEEWHGIIEDTDATPDQLSDAFGVLKAINSDDPQVLGQVYDKLTAELALIGKRIGRAVPGSYDPLAEHADLLEEVENGDLPRVRAMELVQQRAMQANLQQRNQQATQQQGQQQAEQAAIAQVGQLNAQLKASDPDFLRKVPYLQPALATIRQNLPPQQWAQAIADAYRLLPPLPPVANQLPPVTAMPLRPVGGASTMQRKPKSDMEAFEMGAATAR